MASGANDSENNNKYFDQKEKGQIYEAILPLK